MREEHQVTRLELLARYARRRGVLQLRGARQCHARLAVDQLHQARTIETDSGVGPSEDIRHPQVVTGDLDRFTPIDLRNRAAGRRLPPVDRRGGMLRSRPAGGGEIGTRENSDRCHQRNQQRHHDNHNHSRQDARKVARALIQQERQRNLVHGLTSLPSEHRLASMCR
jgi:hypothetical protein